MNPSLDLLAREAGHPGAGRVRVYLFLLTPGGSMSPRAPGSLAEGLALFHSAPGGGGDCSGEATIAANSIDSLAHWPEALALLCPDEHRRAMGFYRPIERTTYVYAHALLRLLLASRLQIEPGALRFEAGPVGKPMLSGHQATMHFNISYRDSAIAIAIGDLPLGVDIEYVRRDLDIPGIVGRFFVGEEQAYIREGGLELQHQRFFHLWARKEALVKASGAGLDALTTFSALHPLSRVPDPEGQRRWYALQTYGAPPGHALALATLSSGPTAPDQAPAR